MNSIILPWISRRMIVRSCHDVFCISSADSCSGQSGGQYRQVKKIALLLQYSLFFIFNRFSLSIGRHGYGSCSFGVDSPVVLNLSKSDGVDSIVSH